MSEHLRFRFLAMQHSCTGRFNCPIDLGEDTGRNARVFFLLIDPSRALRRVQHLRTERPGRLAVNHHPNVNVVMREVPESLTVNISREGATAGTTQFAMLMFRHSCLYQTNIRVTSCPPLMSRLLSPTGRADCQSGVPLSVATSSHPCPCIGKSETSVQRGVEPKRQCAAAAEC